MPFYLELAGGGGVPSTAAWGSIATGTGVASQTDLITYLGTYYVPYTGASANPDMGAHSFIGGPISYGAGANIFTYKLGGGGFGAGYFKNLYLGTTTFEATLGKPGAAAFFTDGVQNVTLADGTYAIKTTGSTLTPKIIGGTTTTSTLTLQTTADVGTTGADIHILVGNNGATEAMTILNDGKVGIGTTAPARPFVVNSNAATTYQAIKSANTGIAGLLLGDQGSDAQGRFSYDNNTDYLSLWAGGNQRMTIKGNAVGIGMGSVFIPTVDLELRSVSTNTATRFYIFPNGAPGAGLQTGIKMFGADFYVDQANYSDFGLYAGSDYNYFNSKHMGTGVAKDFVFTLDDTTYLGIIKMTGDWGIGTTGPDRRLEINVGAATGGMRLTYNDANGSATTYSDFLINSGGDLTITATGGDISFDNEKLATTGTLSAGIITTTGNAKGLPHHLRFTLIAPATAYGINPVFCIWAKTDAAITITNLEVTCDADPTTEITGDLKYADAFIGLANPVVINDFDTTAGVRSDSTITSASVAAGKTIYISFDTTPDAALKEIAFDFTYVYS